MTNKVTKHERLRFILSFCVFLLLERRVISFPHINYVFFPPFFYIFPQAQLKGEIVSIRSPITPSWYLSNQRKKKTPLFFSPFTLPIRVTIFIYFFLPRYVDFFYVPNRSPL